MGAGAGSKSEIDRDAVREIIKNLKKDLDAFSTEAGGPKDIEQHGKVDNTTLAGAQGFATGTQLAMNTENAYTVIKNQYELLVKGYKELIDRLEKAVGDHDKKEEANV